ncbi:hypothetical protein TRIP_B360045 [uncultured Desulfatiglans sp.]|nr:hypothetical protein TRIP_B360045 [uncultured Desulfatiglans sp.]
MTRVKRFRTSGIRSRETGMTKRRSSTRSNLRGCGNERGGGAVRLAVRSAAIRLDLSQDCAEAESVSPELESQRGGLSIDEIAQETLGTAGAMGAGVISVGACLGCAGAKSFLFVGRFPR